MKIIMPVADLESAKDKIAQSFHNADFACLYNTVDRSFEWLPAKEISKSVGNLSIELKRKGIFIVISGQMSLMALGLFTESGITVLKAQGSSIVENIQLFHEEKLKPLSPQLAASCNASCASCSSTTCI